jgi:hypothetical protein
MAQLNDLVDTALLDRDSSLKQAHLDTAERGRQRKVVQVAEVADPEDPPGQLAKAGAQGQVEALQILRLAAPRTFR